MHKLHTLAFSLILILAGSAHADELTAAKRADIRSLIQLTDVNNLPSQFADMTSLQILQQLQSRRGDLTPQAAKAVQQEMQTFFKENNSVIMDRIEPVYASNFTHQEIKEMLVFFKSPAGKKFSGTMPAVLRESIQSGQAWAQSQKTPIESRVKVRLKKEGIDLDQPPAPKQPAAAPGAPAAPSTPAAPPAAPSGKK